MRLHHVVDGPADAPVVVLSGSLGTSLEMWEPQVGPLSKHLRVVRVDRRGHGRSRVSPDTTTLGDLGRDIVELLDELGLERVSFCGLSLGGLEGMWLAANAPERIDRLALCCTAASFPPREVWLDRVAAIRAGGMEAIADAVVARWFTPDFGAGHVETVARLRAMLVATPAEGYVACCEVLADADFGPSLSEIAAPTLVLTGSEDVVVPPVRGDELAASIPSASHTVLEGASHIANVAESDTFTAALLQHLSAEVGVP